MRYSSDFDSEYWEIQRDNAVLGLNGDACPSCGSKDVHIAILMAASFCNECGINCNEFIEKQRKQDPHEKKN